MTTADLQSLVEMAAPGFGFVPFSALVPNNTTGVVVKNGPGLLFSIHGDNNSTVSAFLRIYDKATAPLTTDTPVLRYELYPQASGPLDVETRGAFVFLNGISYRVTTGIADNDATAPAASTYFVSLGFK